MGDVNSRDLEKELADMKLRLDELLERLDDLGSLVEQSLVLLESKWSAERFRDRLSELTKD